MAPQIVVQENRGRIDDSGAVQSLEFPLDVAVVESTHSGAALINEILPSEILLQILRGVKPARRDDFMAPIRLTHVCRFWRALLLHCAAFWLPILNPAGKITYTDRPQKFPIVLAALERSRPVDQLTVSLHGSFLPILSTLPDHSSRMSTLWLNCSYDVGVDAGSLVDLDLHLPQLEHLSLWADCDEGLPLSLDSSYVDFPRLRYLRTNCMRVARRLMTPAIRSLVCGGRYFYSNVKDIPLMCCRFGTLRWLFEVLQDYPDLEELSLNYCLPKATSDYFDLDDIRSFHIRMRNLKVLHIGGDRDVVRETLEHLSFPDTTKITLCTGDSFHTLSDLLPRKRVLPVVPQIRSLTYCSHRTLLPHHKGSIHGEVQGGERRLSLHCGDEVFYCSSSQYDLSAFFKGATACYIPSNITRIRIECFEYLETDRGGYLWLYKHHPRVTELVVDVFEPEDALCPLASGKLLVHLEHLIVIYHVHETSDMEHRVIVRILEGRATSGSRLRSLSFTQKVEEVYARVLLSEDHIARLKAVVEDVMISTVLV